MENKVSLRGKVWSVELQKREFTKGQDKGKPYIFGKISLNCANEGESINIVQLRLFVSKFKKTKEENKSYAVLEELLSLDEAYFRKEDYWLDALGSLITEDYISKKDGELVTLRSLDCGFINKPELENPKAHAYFKGEFIAINFEKKADELGEYAEVKGYTSNYTEQAFPITLSARDEDVISFLGTQGIDEKVPIKFDLVAEFNTLKTQQERKTLVGNSSFGGGGFRNIKEVDITAIYEMTAIGESEQFTLATVKALKEKRNEKIANLRNKQSSPAKENKSTSKEKEAIPVPDLKEELPFTEIEDKKEENNSDDNSGFENWF